MSGDATGFIIGGALILAALPTILTVGACAAATFGIGKLVMGIAKNAVQAERTFERPPKQRLDREAEQHNRRMQEELDRQAEALNYLHRSQTSRLEAAAARLQQAESSGDTKGMEAALKEVKQLEQQICVDLRKGRERIRQESIQHMEQLLHEQAQLQAKAMELLAQKPQDSGARDYATSLIASAIDAFSRLQDIQQTDPDPVLAMRVNQLQNGLIKAQQQMDAGRYQLACIDAAQIVTVSQRLAYQATARHMDLQSRRQWLAANIDAANIELQKAAYVSAHCDGECIVEDLDDFTHGRISQISQQLTALQTKAAQADIADIGAMELQLDELRKQMDSTLAHGRRMMKAFYMRMNLMEKVKQWATGNQYRFSWVSNEGDDVTRPLAAHFEHCVTGNEFTFVLGEEKADEQLETSLSLFFADGQEMSEYEKASMRASLTDYLTREGVQSAMACSGSVNSDSQRQDLRSKASYQQSGKVSA